MNFALKIFITKTILLFTNLSLYSFREFVEIIVIFVCFLCVLSMSIKCENNILSICIALFLQIARLLNKSQIASYSKLNGFAEICYFVHQNNCKMGVQLGHAGRKASMQRPWHGNGPLNQDDFDRGEKNWTISAPSALPLDENWQGQSQQNKMGPQPKIKIKAMAKKTRIIEL